MTMSSDLIRDVALRGQSAQQIYATLAAAAAEKGELIGAWLRGGIAAVLITRNVAFYHEDIARGQIKEVVALILMTIGLLASVMALTGLMRRWLPSLGARMAISTLLDAAILTTMFVFIVLDPESYYRGLLNMPYPAVFTLSIGICGLRIYPRIIALGTALNVACAAGLLVFDKLYTGASADYGIGYITIFFVVLLGQTWLAMALASRLRELVTQGADAALDGERVRARLGAYLSEEIAEAAMAGERIEMGGARQDVAVLFSDLRGFTSYAEHLEPAALVAQINDYFEVMVAEIVREGGVVDKYIGDAIMAVFGAPRSSPDAAARALRAAQGMSRALEAHNAARAAKGLPPLKHGIGVHFGPVIAGNIGTQTRTQYTVIGDAVNLGSRLESATKELGVELLVSRELRDAALASAAALPALRPCGQIMVKGREQAVEVFTLG
jgi:class 3 adenylate cyclase